MIDQLALTITLACLITALYVGVRGLAGRPWPTLAVIEGCVVIQAGIDLFAQAGGRHPGEPVTHLAYLTGAILLIRRKVRPAMICCAVEFLGVLAVGTASIVAPQAFPDATVWSDYGQGYGYVPLVLPLLAIAWAHRHRASQEPR